MPRDFAEAYRIQDAAIAIAGGRIGGWKLGRVPDDQVVALGQERLAGPIFADKIVAVQNASVAMPILRGFAAVEAELLLLVSRDIVEPLTIEEARDSVEDVRLGIEIASSPLPFINDCGAAVTASDFGNNHGLVVGPIVRDWRRKDLLATEMSMEIDGIEVGRGSAANMLDGPFGSLAFLSQLLAERKIPIEAGTWISTGAITGVHAVAADRAVTARFGPDLAVSCRTIPMIRSSDDQGEAA